MHRAQRRSARVPSHRGRTAGDSIDGQPPHHSSCGERSRLCPSPRAPVVSGSRRISRNNLLASWCVRARRPDGALAYVAHLPTSEVRAWQPIDHSTGERPFPRQLSADAPRCPPSTGKRPAFGIAYQEPASSPHHFPVIDREGKQYLRITWRCSVVGYRACSVMAARAMAWWS